SSSTRPPWRGRGRLRGGGKSPFTVTLVAQPAASIRARVANVLRRLITACLVISGRFVRLIMVAPAPVYRRLLGFVKAPQGRRAKRHRPPGLGARLSADDGCAFSALRPCRAEERSVIGRHRGQASAGC